MAGTIIERLRAEYSQWIDNLSEEEIRAIRKYSCNSIDKRRNSIPFFRRLNAMLRGAYNEQDQLMLRRYAGIISGALKKHRLSFPIVCYRGVDVDPTVGVRVGTVFSLDQFASTSVIKTRALDRKYIMVIRVPEGSTGAYIEKISAFPKQREFLLDKDCKYRLNGRRDNVIYLEVVL